MKQDQRYIDIEIDKLTRSIENRITGDNFQTEILLVDSKDLKSITKRNDWFFDWKVEFRMADRDVYKLTNERLRRRAAEYLRELFLFAASGGELTPKEIRDNNSIIQGLISITEREDHIYSI